MLGNRRLGSQTSRSARDSKSMEIDLGLDSKSMKADIRPDQVAGWPLSGAGPGEESPGSMETRCRVTPGGGDLRESATESSPPSGVRVQARMRGSG